MKNTRIRPIQPADDAVTAAVIRQVLTEYGLNREGFAFVDAELEALHENYQPPRAAYHVAEVAGRIVGGAGFGPLLGGDDATAELKKMYLLPEARGLGLGRALMEELLPLVAAAGYTRLYLETMPSMRDAIRLYERYGFKPLDRPLGNTGHHGCQAFYVRSIGSA
ncbi:GNAT family N-acetyltransferase [Oligoflexus tunisiensis]|uniref:GNAT family N-acetyltransferase n=1 Tax=Oligoflexus tunisiensis TaxID=708132 RepID=UPI00114C90B6|nr:GNAT family N-acetyltransferase [Oligoflexus tunisiensis]